MGTTGGPSEALLSHHDARHTSKFGSYWCEMLAGETVGASAGQSEWQHMQRGLGCTRGMEHEESEWTQPTMQGHRIDPHGGLVPVLRYAHKVNGAWVLSHQATELAAQHLIRTREAQRFNKERREATKRLLRGTRPELCDLTLDRWRA